jgi:hypothetical protein
MDLLRKTNDTIYYVVWEYANLVAFAEIMADALSRPDPSPTVENASDQSGGSK